MDETELSAASIAALADRIDLQIQGGLAARPLLSVPHLLSDEASCYCHGYVLAEMAVHQVMHCVMHCVMHGVMHCVMHYGMHYAMHCGIHCGMHYAMHYAIHYAMHYGTHYGIHCGIHCGMHCAGLGRRPSLLRACLA